MATDIELLRSGTWEAIDYSEFSIEVPTSAIGIAPSASVTTQARESIDANQDCRIDIDGTIVFEGVTNSPGTIRQNGQVDLEVNHAADALFAERVTVSLTTPTAEQVLQTALDNSNRGGNFTLDYAGTPAALQSDYDVENRQLTSIFRDMMDRTGRVWWVEPAGSTIHVETVGGRGTWQTIDATTDKAAVRSFDRGSVDTVRNDVTVIATGGEAVSATATDATSISTYGRQSAEYNIGYADTQSEAQDYANELLIPDPLVEAEVLVSQSVGNVTQPLANFTIDLTDDGKEIDETGLVIEKQTIEQSRVTLQAGEGSGVSLENVNRSSKSNRDTTEPGSVYGGDRLADDSVDTPQLVDTAVIEDKLDDLAVATSKLQNNAVINGKLDDLSVSETKIQDDSIATPKLKAEAVTADKIETNTITAVQIAGRTIVAGNIKTDDLTANEIAARTITALEIESDTLTANEIATDTLTANEIATLDLDTNQLTVGQDNQYQIEFSTDTYGTHIVPSADAQSAVGSDTARFNTLFCNTVNPSVGITLPADDTVFAGDSSDSFSAIWSYNYFDASTGTAINDGGDVLSGLSDGHGPPDNAKVTDDDGNELGTDLSELSHTLMDICREQQRQMEAQQDRIDDLETRLEQLEASVGDNA